MADAALKVWNAGRDIDDLASLPPRQFLLGAIFCKGNASMLGGPGAVGKTSVRIAQCLALATGKPLTGERVFKRRDLSSRGCELVRHGQRAPVALLCRAGGPT